MSLRQAIERRNGAVIVSPSVAPANRRCEATGHVGFAGGRWIQVDPLRFVKDKGSGYIVFREDEKGAIRELFAGAYFGWQKAR